MLSEIWKSLAIGLVRRWRSGLLRAFGFVGFVWTITEISAFVSDQIGQFLRQNSDTYLAATGAGAFIWFACHIYEKRSVRFDLPTTDTTIQIRFGDLFAGSDNLLIAVNEFFDSALGHVVVPRSIHGQFITNFYNSDEARFRTDVDAALAQVNSELVDRQDYPPKRYPIGTTAVLSVGPRKAFLFALTHTDLGTSKASADVPMLWTALRGALRAVHEYGNGEPVAMPLIGNGQSSINIEPQHLLRLLVLVVVDFGRQYGLPKRVSIVVPEVCFDRLDIREIARDWRKR